MITGLSMRRLLFLSLFLVTASTSTPTSLSERTLNDFGTLNLGLWNVDLNAVYDFFAAPAVQRNFFIVQTSKVVSFQFPQITNYWNWVGGSQSSYLSRSIFVEKKLSCGEMLGNFGKFCYNLRAFVKFWKIFYNLRAFKWRKNWAQKYICGEKMTKMRTGGSMSRGK